MVRRAQALDRVELRGGDGFVSCADRLPEDRVHVTARAAGGEGGDYLLPFPVFRDAGSWFNARHGNQLQVRIVKWRTAPQEENQ